uniref:Uncharacterized protein n=1 Tax=Romanomermis culicivorax TaxID=13658 RepID=A0A915KEY0_ROMCU
MSTKEIRALKALKSDDRIVILPADKGRAMVMAIRKNLRFGLLNITKCIFSSRIFKHDKKMCTGQKKRALDCYFIQITKTNQSSHSPTRNCPNCDAVEKLPFMRYNLATVGLEIKNNECKLKKKVKLNKLINFKVTKQKFPRISDGPMAENLPSADDRLPMHRPSLESVWQCSQIEYPFT